MKKLIALLALSLMASPAGAASFVTQAVFAISSSATTSTANLRVTPMTPKELGRVADSKDVAQFFLWQANQTQNLYLTKTKTVDLSQAVCAWIQVDQATKVTVNSETAYMTLPSGFNNTVCFK